MISHSKQMSKMYVERWHSAEQCLKCTLKPEAQRTKFSLLKASLTLSKANFVRSKRPWLSAKQILFNICVDSSFSNRMSFRTRFGICKSLKRRCWIKFSMTHDMAAKKSDLQVLAFLLAQKSCQTLPHQNPQQNTLSAFCTHLEHCANTPLLAPCTKRKVCQHLFLNHCS